MTPAQREDYEERAAIMEYDGKLTRAEAERLARRCVKELTAKQALPSNGRT